MPRRTCLLWLALVLGGPLGCDLPTDRSDDLRVEVGALPTLLLKDSFALEARVVDGAGTVVPGAVLDFASSDPTVLSVNQEGVLRAVGAGTATLTVSAISFAGAAPFTQAVRVRGRLEVDSVVPLQVRFGDTLSIFGVGLSPDSLFQISVGGTEATAKSFLPVDPLRPEGEGELRVWVRPPAERRGALTVLGFAGGLVFPDTVTVQQRDLYEPNDTVPWFLGAVSQGFRNPGLAFEPRQRTSSLDQDLQSADWYTFENTVSQDRTVVFFSENVGAQSFGVFVTDSLWWSGGALDYRVGSDSWTVGLGTYLCGGLSFTRAGEPVKVEEVLFPLSIVAIKDLPPGTYHVFVPYFPLGTPAAYELVIASEYLSVIPPDPAEENDFCDVATPLPVAGRSEHSSDNQHDVDWFRFSTATPGAFSVTVTASDADADLDLYLARDYRPDSLVVVALGSEPGVTETLSGLVPAGDYFLLVVDFPGVSTPYELTVGSLPGPSVASATAGRSLDEQLERLRSKRAGSSPGRPGRLIPQPRR